ncbi:hypothetical protein KIN20_014995 [Parelaphostrongylus tenuis]|uniref:Uncharacterized protein n=1 Tax=Parelaphostrongylus tenuis TaxID=148309 RepID=A0AAD5QLY2_PARTN|nr:hypothetical protein KIN20_014995 [Parelaphostrongylus tenuis]
MTFHKDALLGARFLDVKGEKFYLKKRCDDPKKPLISDRQYLFYHTICIRDFQVEKVVTGFDIKTALSSCRSLNIEVISNDGLLPSGWLRGLGAAGHGVDPPLLQHCAAINNDCPADFPSLAIFAIARDVLNQYSTAFLNKIQSPSMRGGESSVRILGPVQ